MPIDPGTATLGGAGISAAGSLIGGAIGSSSNKKVAKQQWRRTKKLAQNQIQWRVKDAQQAGIHPLAALGMSPIGNAAMPTGSVMGDAIQNAAGSIGQGVSDYGRQQASAPVAAAALAESQARTAASLAQADRDTAEADYTRSQQLWSTLGRFKSPGRPGTNEFGQTYKLPGPGPHTIPKYLDPATRPISQAHAQMLEDTTPGAVKSGKVTIHGANGLEWPVDPSWTPGGIIEELLGEWGSVISLLNVLNSAPDATENKKYLRKGDYWWQDKKGYDAYRDFTRKSYERMQK